MIIDFHTHLLPKYVRENRSVFFDQDPAFKSLYSSPKARLASEEDIIGHMDESGIDQSVVFGFPWLSRELIERNNDEVWDFHQKYPDRIIPFAALSSSGADHMVLEASNRLAQGFRGLGELAVYAKGWDREALDALSPILHIADKNNSIVLIHINEPVGHRYPGKIDIDFQSLLEMIKGFPHLSFVLAHMGGGLFIYGLMPEIATIMENTYLDTAAAPFLYDPRIYKTASDLMGREKILFGSDFPLLGLPRYMRHIDSGNPDPDLKDAILGENAKRLLEKTIS